jgi:Na+:H+ antiporter, NhaA family
LAGTGYDAAVIAGQAFPEAADFAAAKVAVFVASVLSTLIAVAVLWNARLRTDGDA